MSTEPTTVIYPKATSDGFSFENETDEQMEIETATYENGSIVKRIKMSNGSIALVRELRGKDMSTVSRISGGDENKYAVAMCSLAVKINGEKVVPEELDEMKAKDYNRIMAANSALNF